jgi:hypothetical protein
VGAAGTAVAERLEAVKVSSPVGELLSTAAAAAVVAAAAVGVVYLLRRRR